MNSKGAVITGASRGLCRSMALHLGIQGVSIVGTFHRKEDEAKEVVSEIEERRARAVMLQLDIGDSKGFEAFVSTLSSSLGQTFNPVGQLRLDQRRTHRGLRRSEHLTTHPH